MKLTRRRYLQGGLAIGATALVPFPLFSAGCFEEEADSPVFVHGIASGDPLPQAIILWTRVTNTSTATGETSVAWEIAKDAAFQQRVKNGTTTTSAERDFTVKVDVTELEPATTYFYRFSALGQTSPIGRTKTAPLDATRLRFAVVSCASMAHGYFHVYRLISQRLDLDAVVHLGDYIYEYGNDGTYGELRPYEPVHEIVDLADYRMRHSQYKRDKDLQALHQQHPIILTWDDHETADNSWKGGAANHDPGVEGSWDDRKAAGTRAYAEWMPVRDQADGRLFRTLRYGNLAELIVLDTRLFARDMQVERGDAHLTDDGRTLLGTEQEAWLEERLKTSTSQWKIIAQQVMVGQLPQFLNTDAWDGYPKGRKRFFDMIRKHTVKDVVVLTGDIHTTWVMDLTDDPTLPAYDPATGAGAVAVEFVSPAVSSPGLAGVSGLADGLMKDNRHMRYVELSLRGYYILDVTPARAQAAFFHVDQVTEPTLATETMSGAFATYTGTSNVKKEASAAEPAPAPPGAPIDG